MLTSMTGHGQSIVQTDKLRVLAEVKSVNNRFLKTHIQCGLDVNRQSQIENLICQFANRGTVNLNVKIERLGEQDVYRLNQAAIRSYWLQLSEIAGNSQTINIESLLQLPGVVHEEFLEDDSEIWPTVEQAVKESLQNLSKMRRHEGEVMKTDLLQNLNEIETQLQSIAKLAPSVVLAYEQRLTDRIKTLLEKHDVVAPTVDVIREVGIFAERVDISEEIVRLGSHIAKFRQLCSNSDSSGRTLDFLVQEMLRETNTIGSKAANAEIASNVIAIKTMIERIREMVQNVE